MKNDYALIKKNMLLELATFNMALKFSYLKRDTIRKRKH